MTGPIAGSGLLLLSLPRHGSFYEPESSGDRSVCEFFPQA
jgi:hypothetical protein